ncbi:hypothetical protein HKD37_08G021741 [Glycine soja]|uniref:Anther-specific protein BCP1 n=1 Tax=Glycine soja TaxID=3848 RepID=A0A445JE23_GLYSO|nr:uncharacterized protein LOC114421820 [Glycine soja]KAH1237006.1 hypothetical protein GmHk_08G022068 [Glycine max]RZB96684.1 hypothetical protein D0Y65_020421 [Glycine soja]
MARASRVVVLALVMFAMIGLACAAPAPEASDDDYEGDDYSIGALTSGAASSPNGVAAAPIGGPVPPGAFDNAKGGLAPSAASSSLAHFSTVAGAASAALAGFFYF